MKLGLFSDSHYSSTERSCGCRYNSKSLQKLREAYRIFEDAGCDLVLCLGDLTDTEATYEKECENLRACAAVMDASSVPTICVMGNHDAFAFTEAAFYELLGQTRRPRTLALDGVTLLFVDACHYANGKHYQPGDSDWTDTFFPYTGALEQELSEIAGPVCVCMHQNLDPAIPQNHRLANDAALRALFASCGSVTHVISGHYHPGADHTIDHIRYLTLPALCERKTADAVQILALSSGAEYGVFR